MCTLETPRLHQASAQLLPYFAPQRVGHLLRLAASSRGAALYTDASSFSGIVPTTTVDSTLTTLPTHH